MSNKFMKTMQDSHGRQVACIHIRVCGIPMWIESKSVGKFYWNAFRVQRFTRHAHKAIRQMRQLCILADSLGKYLGIQEYPAPLQDSTDSAADAKAES